MFSLLQTLDIPYVVKYYTVSGLYACMRMGLCGGQRTTHGSWLSPQADWVLEIEFRTQAWQPVLCPLSHLTGLAVSRVSTEIFQLPNEMCSTATRTRDGCRVLTPGIQSFFLLGYW